VMIESAGTRHTDVGIEVQQFFRNETHGRGNRISEFVRTLSRVATSPAQRLLFRQDAVRERQRPNQIIIILRFQETVRKSS